MLFLDKFKILAKKGGEADKMAITKVLINLRKSICQGSLNLSNATSMITALL